MKSRLGKADSIFKRTRGVEGRYGKGPGRRRPAAGGDIRRKQADGHPSAWPGGLP